MENLLFAFSQGFSAVIAFVLVWFMTKPYRMTGESRFLGLPIGFAFLGVSYLFGGASFLLGDSLLLEGMKWLQLFTGAYALVFIAVTYYLSSGNRGRKARLLMQGLISLVVLALILLLAIVFSPPKFTLPSYRVVDEYFRFFDMILALYVVFQTLRSHILRPEPKAVFAPLGYALLGFSEYSFMIWSIDSSFSAFVGAHTLRIFGLLVFLYVSYQAMIATPKPISGGTRKNEAAPKG